MSFVIDGRILSTCFEIGKWPLSRVFLKNNGCYPWLILVPEQEDLQDIDQLPPRLRYVFMDEISQLSLIVKSYFKPDKLNIGALGNIVPQLHMHVIARFKHDDLWPHGVWQSLQTITPYPKDILNALLGDLRHRVSEAFCEKIKDSWGNK